MYIVIGSGPAGIAAAFALAEKGKKVLLVDAGKPLRVNPSQDLDGERRVLTPYREHREYLDWFPRKLLRGSASVYEALVENQEVEIPASYVPGGLTRVWGGAVLPSLPWDLQDWPIPYEELAPYYEPVLSLFRLSATSDPLASLFPLPGHPLYPLPLAPQLEEVERMLYQKNDTLKSLGIVWGRSRLAMHPEFLQEQCTLCGECFFGCPHNLIYQTPTSLSKMVEHLAVEYLSGMEVTEIRELGKKLEVVGVRASTGERVVLEGEKVYLGCGALSSSRILLHSLKAQDKTLVLKANNLFILPLLRWEGHRLHPSSHAMAQMFLEFLDLCSCKHTLHVQLYTPTIPLVPLIQEALALKFPFLPSFLLRWLPEHLFVLLAFLHSHHSDRFLLTLTKEGRFRVKVSRNPGAKALLFKVWKKLLHLSRVFKGWAIPWVSPTPPGRGMHFGGSFPMSSSPSRLETDLLGRPYGFSKLFVIDTTVFPSLPPTTITLTEMANAYRIATCSEIYS